MSRPFTNITSANKTFGQFKESTDAGEYIYNKKARATYCVANKCAPSIKVYSEGDRLLFNKSNQLSLYPCANAINSANLNINLITRLNLRNVPVIQDASSGAIPSTITLDSVPFLDYVIDPSGALFGNSICGINNYLNYLRPNTQVSPYILISGNYEITSNSTYNTIITFYGNSVIEFTKSIQINYTLVGGGGGGGATNGVSYGGGGGGQVKIGIFNTQFETFNITIGSGGAGRSSATGLNGGSSSIISTSSTITSLGGFGSIANGNGGNSGSGGAGGTFYNGFPPAPSTINGVNGGGGAGGSGQQALAGNGGLNNVNPNYGGGGGGGSGNGFISGGLGVGGGGNGGNVSSNGKNAILNTGGGGGGGGDAGTTQGGNGGSGVAIFSFNV